MVGWWWWVGWWWGKSAVWVVSLRPGMFAKQKAASALGKSHASVTARSTDMFEFKRLLGFVWPVNVYVREKNGEKPPRKAIKSYEVGAGVKVRGVLMPKSAGEPVGCIAMHQIRQTASELAVEVANTEQNDAEEVHNAWEQAQKRHKCQLRTPEKAKPGEKQDETLTLRMPKFKDDGDSSGDDALYSAVWGRQCTAKASKGDKKGDEDIDVESAVTPRCRRQLPGSWIAWSDHIMISF